MSDEPMPAAMEPFASITVFLRAFVMLCGSITASAGFIGAIGWFVLQPRLEPYLTAIEQIPQLSDRLQTLEGRVPPTPVIIFRDTPYVEPQTVRAGEQVRVQYFVQRTESCTTEVLPRFYSYSAQGYDPRFIGERRPTLRSPVSDSMLTLPVVVHIPPDMEPGNWAYAPEVIPGEDCRSRQVLYPPLAEFNVVK